MLKNVCGEKLGKSLLRRMQRTQISRSLKQRNILRSASLQSVNRLFKRLKRVQQWGRKRRVELIRESYSSQRPVRLQNRKIEDYSDTKLSPERVESSTQRSLSKKNETRKKFLRSSQRRTMGEDSFSVEDLFAVHNGEGIALFAIASQA